MAFASETSNASIRPGMAGVYIADPTYTLNVRKLMENVVNERFPKDQFLISNRMFRNESTDI